MHKRFCQYGELVEPELMQQFTEQLKWDVVGYLGYKEYALQAPFDCFEEIAAYDSSRWRDLGEQLYNQSQIADLSNNHYSYDIETRIIEVAAKCGIADYWELRNWDDEFRFKPDHIHNSLFGFIRIASSIEELKAIWIVQKRKDGTEYVTKKSIREQNPDMDKEFLASFTLAHPEVFSDFKASTKNKLDILSGEGLEVYGKTR